jgi:hypothetical protein
MSTSDISVCNYRTLKDFFETGTEQLVRHLVMHDFEARIWMTQAGHRRVQTLRGYTPIVFAAYTLEGLHLLLLLLLQQARNSIRDGLTPSCFRLWTAYQGQHLLQFECLNLHQEFYGEDRIHDSVSGYWPYSFKCTTNLMWENTNKNYSSTSFCYPNSDYVTKFQCT